VEGARFSAAGIELPKGTRSLDLDAFAPPFTNGRSSISRLAVSADGRYLAAGSRSGYQEGGARGPHETVVYDLADGRDIVMIRSRVGPSRGLAWAAEGRVLLRTMGDGSILAWDLAAYLP
jgi:hypothetical protein